MPMPRRALALASALAAPGLAAAFPTMIAHQYTSCAQCHVDPSGAGALTEYGRAQAEVLVRSRYGGEIEEPGREKDFLFGALPLPDAVALQADLRVAVVPRPGQVDAILMQGDLRGAVRTDHVGAYASLGVAEGAQAAWLSRVPDSDVQFVARDYWVGASPAPDVWVRAGRMAAPFGIRTENHLLFSRALTRTSLNDDQPTGVAISGAGRRWRGEVMAVVGNPQIAPDAYRERGVVGFLAAHPRADLEVGVSTLATRAALDVDAREPLTRQAHGAFARWSPASRVAVLAEADLLVDVAAEALTVGGLGVVEVDWEFAQGAHVKGVGELCAAEGGARRRAWATLQWFLLPRLDLRADLLWGPLACSSQAEARPMGFAQLHAWL
jgi:hypothetical protein